MLSFSPKNPSAGFTILELLMVVAIIGILTAITIGAITNARSKARDRAVLVEIKALQNALELYYTKYGYYPSTSGGYQCTSGTGINNCTPGTTVLQALVTEGFLSKVPVGPGADGSGVDNDEIWYGSPGWWDTSWAYQIQYQFENRDDSVGACSGGNCAQQWGTRYMRSFYVK